MIPLKTSRVNILIKYWGIINNSTFKGSGIMQWVIVSIVSWIIFILLIDLKQIKYTIWAGVLSVISQLIIDNMAFHLKLYDFKNDIIEIFNSSLFFTFGAPFTIGTIFAQTYPKNRMLRFINIFASTALFFVLEYALKLSGVLEYIHWHYFYSITIDVLVLMSLGNFITIFKLVPWMRSEEEDNER